MMDYGSLGFCALDCRDAVGERDKEFVSILSNIRPGRRKVQSWASAIGEDNEPDRRKADLQQRLEKFQSKGWLSQQEHRKYSAFLSTFDHTAKIGESGNFALKELEVELNLKENRMSGKQSTWKRIPTPTGAKQGRISLGVYSNNSPRPMSQSPKSLRSFESATNRTFNGVTAEQGTIVAPSSLSTSLSADAIAGLFTETCFFARLGFVQPPCCLQCNYREAIQSASPRLNCKRWVIWRRNANKTLHPSNICDNSIAVQCHSARKLTAGNIVESYKWDRTRKVLIEPSFLRSRNKNQFCTL
ncbi:hypothetical protein IV203_027900 [Nitzschia inconspicua]|uniref:Uncharacterized protein n=1 Tax=Nitzschia inconspicua TaxID=303405 RepID=A0A9K3Q6H3_9STRA|nr:hypothetical protein IV203_027900 [Nitzschia inconspicua]